MPIKSLQVTQSSVHEGLSCIGKIRKGAPKEIKRDRNGKEYTTVGKDLEHFRFTAEPEFAGAERVFDDIYGPEPTFFDPVFILGETVEDAFNPWMEEWNATVLLHRCDEVEQVRHYIKSTEMYSSARIPCERLCDRTCGCKPVGRLSLLMPQLMIELGVSGYVSVETHSVNDILSLQHALIAAVEMTGRITGVAFIFGRAPEKISARTVDREGNAKRINTTKSLFFLRPNEDYTRNNILPELAAAGNRPLFGNGQSPHAMQLEDGQTPFERLRGHQPASRRIGAPPAPAPVQVLNDSAAADNVQTVNGEVVDETPSDPPAQAQQSQSTGKKWTPPEYRKWAATKQSKDGLTEADLLKALAVDSFEAFHGSIADADAKVGAYIAAQLDGKQRPDPATP